MTDAPQPTEINLSPSLRHGEAPELLKQLQDAKGSDVVVNGANVELLGASCAQILIAGAEMWSDGDHAFSIVDASEKFISDAALLGASSALGLAEVAAE